MKKIGNIGLFILAAGFVIGFGADIVLLVMGRAMALPFLGVLLVLGWVAYQVALKWIPPVIIETPEAPPGGDGVAGCAASGALLVRDPAGEGRDRGAGWYNTLSAAIGPVAVAAPADMPAAASEKKIIVIPQNELTSLLSKSGDAVDALAKNAVVVLDNPDPAALAALGISVDAETATGTVTWVDGDILTPDMARLLERCPLPVTAQRMNAIPDAYSVWMCVAHHPAVLGRATENGATLIFLFDFARLCTLMRQGRDAPDAVLSLTGSRPHLRVPHALRDNDTPWADLFTAFFMSIARRFTPFSCWWPHPDGAPATLVVTADDDGSGERAAVIAQLLGGAPATLFAAADAPAPAGFDRGLLWNRYALRAERGGARRNAKPALADQLQSLRESADGAGAVVSRVLDGRFDGGADEAFELLERNNVAADCSFGPGAAHAGYTFATGFPFHPIAASGRAHAPLELPYQVHDLGGVPSREWIERLFEDAANTFGSVVTVALHPRRCIQSPAMRAAIKKLGESARERNFHITGAAAYIAFWKGRAGSPITCNLKEDALTIAAQAETGGLALLLPASLRGKKRKDVLLNGNQINELKNDLLPLTKGTHTITIVFES